MTEYQLSYEKFPLEIFDKISFYLTNKQRGVCKSVCRSWRKLFTPSQYRHIYIKGKRQFSYFYDSLQYGMAGHYVRRLSVDDVYMTTKELELLPELCPNLVALSFNGKLIHDADYYNNAITSQKEIPFFQWKNLRRLTELLDLTVTNHLLQAPSSSLSSLTHLSVRFNGDHEMIKDDFLASLYKAKDLIHLSLDSVTLSLNEIETIHTSCPHLQKLRLINTVLRPIDTTFEEKRTVGSRYSFTPAKRMKTFEFENSRDLYENYEWLYYFAVKYASIENLELWCEYSVDHPSRYSQNLHEREERYNALAKLVMSCHSLKSLKLLNIEMNYWLFEAMDYAGIQLESIALGDMTDNTIDLLQYLGQSRQNVSNLTLWGWPSLCIQETMEEAIAIIGQCSHRLHSLTFSMRFSGIKNAPIPLDILLNRCAHLKYLKLDNIQATLVLPFELVSEAAIAYPKSFLRPNLEHLVFENGSFRNQIFNYLDLRCPSLKRLEIDSCALIGDCNKMEVKIDMPHHQFEMISINHIRPPTFYHHAKPASDIRSFDVSIFNKKKQNTDGYWRQIYELSEYEKYTTYLSFDYEQKPLETCRPTQYICYENASERSEGPFVSINCYSLVELNIGGLWVI
ncbi:uncharacterized protein BX663DRAFT_144417 [Cokeromyces recurvatus]|uniref:uncharacterized protein n=1 Tax=Cokeromyces recurvatus TaxID=90255 RepID=UPI00221E573C|nr:uncharacterized protein BX663DRAFT_144417 [Cokeromyces recurvatus]KAI7901077.1 hypothetical protein BX663DRAFT_144417 [Cokeromyces recurvatus]